MARKKKPQPISKAKAKAKPSPKRKTVRAKAGKKSKPTKKNTKQKSVKPIKTTRSKSKSPAPVKAKVTKTKSHSKPPATKSGKKVNTTQAKRKELKQKIRKQKSKGTSHIRRVLGKYWKKKFKDKDVRAQWASDIEEILLKNGQTYSVANIRAAIKELRERKKRPPGIPPKPEIDPAVFSVEVYYEIQNLLDYVRILPKELNIRGKMVFEERTRRYYGQEEIPYEQVAGFVAFCDAERNKISPDRKSDDIMWYVKYTDLCHDKKTNEWFTSIISCNFKGGETNFGYQGRSNFDVKDECEEDEKKESPPVSGPITPPATPPTGDIEDKISAEKLHREQEITRIDILDKQKESLIKSKDSVLEDIKTLRSIGIDTAKELAKFRQLQDDIDAIDEQIKFGKTTTVVAPEVTPTKIKQLNLFDVFKFTKED